MTNNEIMEKHLHCLATCKKTNKNIDTKTYFNRHAFWYLKKELDIQKEICSNTLVNEKEHKKNIILASEKIRSNNAHKIAKFILTNKLFKQYRADAFKGKGSYFKDYDVLIKKIHNIYGAEQKEIPKVDLKDKFKTNVLVQINHIRNTFQKVTLPKTKLTLKEWAIKFNINAPKHISYIVNKT